MNGNAPPPREYQRFLGLPWRWWRHLPHWHVAVFLNEIGYIKCAVCWKDWPPSPARI